MSTMDETLDILIKLEFPALPIGWALGNYILANAESTEPAIPPQQAEFIFRFNYDRSFIRYGLGAISALFLPKLSFWYESSSAKKMDYDITYLWSNLVQHFKPTLHGVPAISDTSCIPEWVRYSRDAIQQGDIQLCTTGVGGTYFVTRPSADPEEDDCAIAVYKPIDEEPGAPNNPKKQSNFVPMLPWGGGANREVAAYKIGGGLAGVPETYFVECEIPDGTVKRGSIQKFVVNDGDCSEFGANKFSNDSVHRLGIFDIMILNMDRNDENLLVQKSDADWKLVPIDHTYCFPPRVASYFNWQYWPQAKKPFSDESLAYIASVNVMDNAMTLLDTGIDESSVRNVMASTLLLQKAAQCGFNLFQIASFVSGEKNDLVDILGQASEKEGEYYRHPQLFPLTSSLQRLTLFRNICERLVEAFIQKKSDVVY
jgi:hypothetical protein